MDLVRELVSDVDPRVDDVARDEVEVPARRSGLETACAYDLFIVQALD